MELLAGLVFDLVGIALEALDVALQEVVLVLELLHFDVEGAGLVALLLVDGDAVCAEDDVVCDRDGEEGGSGGGELALIDAPGFEQAVDPRKTRGDAEAAGAECHTFSMRFA